MITDTSNQIEANESDYLFVQTSNLPNSGRGLHTAVTIYKDEVISVFKGHILTERQVQIRVNKDHDKYFIELLDGRIMDAMKVNGFAKYANDAKGYSNSTYRNNAKIAYDENDQICLIATRKINAGEEIFCSYGKKYWEKHG